jgi:hypothetical protein
MLAQTTRRQAIKLMAGGTTAAAIGVLFPNTARAEWNPIPFYLKGDGWDSYGRRQIISQAMYLINDRFLDPRIATNGYSVDGDAYRVEGYLWNTTNLNSYYTGKGYRDILWYQLGSLRQTRKRPELSIWAQYEPNLNAYGWANYNKVNVKFSKEGFVTDGDFVIALNTRFLGGGGFYSDPYIWAGTIAHEMLHNLGHGHLPNRNDPAYDRCQLIAHERAVYYGGRYKRGLNRPVILCGGRWNER